MAYIEWTILATGQEKRTKHAMPVATAQKLCAWLNKPNTASAYRVVGA